MQEPQGLTQLLLASQSPRRRDLLEAAGLPFVVVEPGDENAFDLPPYGDHAPDQAAVLRARAKAAGAEPHGHAGILLAVDTIVTLAGRIFGKPRDEDEARSTLATLTGEPHEVVTAHAFRRVFHAAADRKPAPEALRVEVSRARVLLEARPAEDVERYLASRDWADKAGGYGIQSEAADFARLIDGRYDTVVGLDVSVVDRVFREWTSCPDGGDRLRSWG
ncbi:MAG: Maf-like protein [Planctomycetes bacterium]|nr:Maf-like protein [Planctomycetota bacterium]MCB9892079.1 Maf-like protein [Planctomycetota bacterium]MCB9920349.1 Maf-like protein [Planctomycetota bacterium]